MIEFNSLKRRVVNLMKLKQGKSFLEEFGDSKTPCLSEWLMKMFHVLVFNRKKGETKRKTH